MSEDEIVFRQQTKDRYTLEFPFNEEFIDYVKRRVASADRQYDPNTHIWTVTDQDGKTLNALTGIALQKFRFCTLWYRNAEGKLVMKNLRTGAEAIQESLFG